MLARQPGDTGTSADYFKPKGKGEFELIAVRIPFGCTLIVEKGRIHGDANIKGMYMMAMTSDHNLMNTADAVFMRSETNPINTARVRMQNETVEPGDMSRSLHDKLRPLVPNINMNGEM